MNLPGDNGFTGCPHFLSDTKSCGLSQGGIYIPMKIHMMNFCMTDQFNQCATYIKYRKGNKNESSTSASSRRRHRRRSEIRKVLLRSSDEVGILEGDFMKDAMTLDLSQGGMRVLVEKEIPLDTTFLFNFGEDFMVPNLQGVARLCWHRPFKKNPQITEAGLVFKDKFSQAILDIEFENRN